MSPTIHDKYKYFYSAVQRAKDRRQKFNFCRLPFGVTSSLISLLSTHQLIKANYLVILPTDAAPQSLIHFLNFVLTLTIRRLMNLRLFACEIR